MQRIPVNLTNDCSGNQLNHNNDLPAIENKNYVLQKPFTVCYLLSGPRQPTMLWPKAPDFALQHIFLF